MHRSPMNTTILKTLGFWVALISAALGVVLSQHVVTEGSTIADIIGWLLTFGGSVGVGHQAGVAKQLTA